MVVRKPPYEKWWLDFQGFVLLISPRSFWNLAGVPRSYGPVVDRGSLRTPVKMAQMLHGTWNVYLHLTIVTTGFWNVLLGKLICNTIMKVLKRWLSSSSRWFLRGVLPLKDGGFGRRSFCLLGWHCFRCHVSFREGKQHTTNGWAPGIFIVESDILFNTIIVFWDPCSCFQGVLWCKHYIYIYIYDF